jgi:hypothetical protein
MLGDCLSGLHAKLAEAVNAAVDGVLRKGHLSLSQLARSLASSTAMRYRVKRIDRLLGNASLPSARLDIYRKLAALWLSGLDNVLVLIDGSDATTDQRWHLLRASIAVEGRSVTLFQFPIQMRINIALRSGQGRSYIIPVSNANWNYTKKFTRNELMEIGRSTVGFSPVWQSCCPLTASQ